MQKGQIFIWIIVGVLVIAIAGGAYYLGRQTSPKSSPNPVVTSPTPQPTPSPSDETANWKVYRNTKYNFSFKYPSNWQPGWGTIGDGPTEKQMEESNSLGWIRTNQDSPFSVFSFHLIGVCNSPLESCFKDFQKDDSSNYESDITTTKTSNFLSNNAIIAQYIDKYSGQKPITVTGTFFVNNNNLWLLERQIVTQSIPSENLTIEKEIEKIFSTFKFL